MATAQATTGVSLKRDRSISTNNLFRSESIFSVGEQISAPALPLLQPLNEETKCSYFQRLSQHIDTSLFKPATEFVKDGIYLYKRPVRSNSNQDALLAQAGTVFQHCVIYIKKGDKLVSLEFSPANSMDITSNFLQEANAAPVFSDRPANPERECLPMMYINHGHHSLEAQHVEQALRFAEARPYHALRNNCIAFADFAVRVLTGGAIKSAPLVFDLVAGKVPPQDSPLLAFLFMATQMTWFNICDGSRLMADFLMHHPSPPPLPPAPTSDLAPITAGNAVPAWQGGSANEWDSIATAAAAAAAEAEEAAAAAMVAAEGPAAVVSTLQQLQQAEAVPVGDVPAASAKELGRWCDEEGVDRAVLGCAADSSVSETTGLEVQAPLLSVPSVSSLLQRAGTSSSSTSGGGCPSGLGKLLDPLGRATKRRVARGV